MGHPPRIPVWLRWDKSVIYFVTICVEARKPVLANQSAFLAFKKAAAKLRDWTVLSAVLMPRSSSCHCIADKKSRSETRQFFSRNKALDARRPENFVEM